MSRGTHAHARFLATTLLLVLGRALDALSTWIATPDLALEANPLARLAHAGWRGLLLVNAFVLAFLIVGAWHACFAPPALPTEPRLDLESFIARFWFSVPGRRSVLQAVFWLPADTRVRWAFIGGPGAVLVVIASVVVAAWNLLVANGFVRSPRVGRLWLAIFAAGLAGGICISVRIFLARAYARYARTTSGAVDATLA